MTATALLHGFGLFALCLGGHLLLWHLRRPENDPLALALIFLGPPALLAAALVAAPSCVPLADGAAALLLHLSLSIAYIAGYPAAQAVSPSLAIVAAVARSMPRGMTRRELHERFDHDLLVGERCGDLVRLGLVREDGGKAILTPQAKRLLALFALYRRMLGAQPGEG